MSELFDFIKTPEGQGLLSAAFTGLATAQRGAPLNSIGRAGMGGLLGYSNAMNAQDTRAENEQQKRLREMQIKQMELMNPLQLEQLQTSIAQTRQQADFAKKLPEILSGIQGAQPQTYQDQLPNNADVKWNGKPEEYFKSVMGIQDPTEKRSALEAGFRQWPEYRPAVPTQANRNASIDLGNFAASAGAAGLHGADTLMKLAELYKPMQMQGGSYYQNANGTREFVPVMKEGMTPDGSGGVRSMPGFLDFVRQKTMAEVNPVDAAKLKYETGMDVSGGNKENTGTPTGLPPKANTAVKEGAFTGANEDWIKNSYRPTLDAGKNADNIITTTTSLRNIDMKTGWGTEAKASAANVLAGLGIAPENAKMYAANAQQFQSQAMTRLWEVLNTAKGPQTEGDADRAKATFASLKNTNEANNFIVDLAEANARRDKMRSQFYAEAMPIARNEGDLTAVDRKWQQIQKSVWSDPIMAKWRK